MGWADNYIKQLKEGKTITFRPRGGSMRGKIESGQQVKVSPSLNELKEGDIVLCKVSGHQYLHLIKKINPVDKRFLIGNNLGGENGWTGLNRIYGKVIEIEGRIL